nr:hypothetical protein [Tanacetum cinerariifolium]
MMDDPNIAMEEYIRFQVEKARRHGRRFNWENTTHGALEDVDGAHAHVKHVQADSAPVQTPQPPSKVASVIRTMPHRMESLEEEVHGLKESLDKQRKVMDAMARDLFRFTVWETSGILQLLDLSGATYTRYSKTYVPYPRRRVRQVTDGAST